MTALTSGPTPAARLHRRRWWVGPFLLVLVAAGTLSGAEWYASAFNGRIYPGVSIGGVRLGGRTQEEARQALQARLTPVVNAGLVFTGGDVTVKVAQTVLASDPDLSRSLYSYDADAAVAAAYRLGRSGAWPADLLTALDLRLRGRVLDVPLDLNLTDLRDALAGSFAVAENPAEDARLVVAADGTVTVRPERAGRAFDYDAAIRAARQQLASLDARPIAVALRADAPRLFAADAAAAAARAQELLATTTPTFTYATQRWPLTRETFARWLALRAPEAGRRGAPLTLAINAAAAQPFFDEIAAAVNIEPRDAKFTLQDGRVTEFQASQDGARLNVPVTLESLERTVLANGEHEVALVVEVTPAKITTSEVNDLGIRELLGEGRSNFAGSPKNRRQNIKVGVDTLNGILIAPDEEFSLLKALGPVDGEHDYLPELVIKGDRTVPEFGGGLCQIGTTTFRAALKSGLPITKRQNHSFRVRYYDPPGMDATIYDPAPDFRFTNDTGNHILFIAAIEGDQLAFRFYGTPDGRVTKVPDRATILSTTPSGPVRYIPSPDLAPGQKKLVEKPAPGGKTTFTYEVTYPDGKVNKQIFTSEYRPWAETWLVGATSTPEGTPETATGAESGG